jgi:DNA-binding MurR/RpiR family transcriptional regulator
MSLAELAAVAKASEGSVVQLCQQIGLSGFQALKIALAREAGSARATLHEDIVERDGVPEAIDKIFNGAVAALEDTRKVADASAVAAAVDAILGARRLEIYGIGTAAPIAEDAAYRLRRLGVVAAPVTDSHMQAVAAGLAGPDVATLTISHSGRTLETLTATRLAKAAGARTLAITNYGKSPLLEFVDIALFTAARETRYRMEAMSSRIAQLAVIDVLYASLALRRWKSALATVARAHEIVAAKRI